MIKRVDGVEWDCGIAHVLGLQHVAALPVVAELGFVQVHFLPGCLVVHGNNLHAHVEAEDRGVVGRVEAEAVWVGPASVRCTWIKYATPHLVIWYLFLATNFCASTVLLAISVVNV